MTAPDRVAIREALESVDPLLFNTDYADAQDAAVARLMEDYAAERVREALNAAADAIEEQWEWACSGYRNTGRCESCRAYEAAASIVRYRAGGAS